MRCKRLFFGAYVLPLFCFFCAYLLFFFSFFACVFIFVVFFLLLFSNLGLDFGLGFAFLFSGF